MRISDIMKTNVSGERLPDKLRGDLEVSALSQKYKIEGRTTYEVIDVEENKIGEVSGEKLQFLIDTAERLNLMEIVDNLDDGIIVLDEQGRICFENEAYSRILGVPMRKTIGRNLYVIEKGALLLNVLRTGKPVTNDKQHIESVDKYVSMRAFPIIKDGKIEGAYSIFRDVTELNQLNREVKRITQVAREYSNQIYAAKEVFRSEMISSDDKYLNLIDQAVTVAKTDVPVLIRGENGSGKEVLAKLIHRNSSRKEKPFIAVNCAAIPENLIESELFGYEEGSFTGSKKGGKMGKFELAQGGTLFLDEIGDMPLLMQTKLLRALQEGEIEKVGGRNLSVDVRILAATNQPLEEMIDEKVFRQDLYYRLNVVSLRVPPLRERPSDIVLLANHFMLKFAEKYKKEIALSQEAFDALRKHSWPGNVRELQNCIESAVIMCSSNTIRSEHFSFSGGKEQKKEQQDGGRLQESSMQTASGLSYNPAWRKAGGETGFGSLKAETEAFEQYVIRQVLDQCCGNREEAIRRLGISRRTFYRKLG